MADETTVVPHEPFLKPAVAALLFLPILEWLPVWLIWASRQNYSRSGQVIGACLALLCAIPAVGIALEKPWGIGGARYILFFGLLVGAMKVFGDRTWSAHTIVHGLTFLAAMAGLGSERVIAQPRTENDDERPPADDGPRWLKENVEALLVAFVMALIIRCFCLEVFMIPSSSMEPTLIGRESGGDRIMVTKFYTTLAPVERFDVMVFKFPLNQVKNFIKRVVGTPGEDFFVEHGNVWFHKDGDPDPRFRIGRRPLRVQQSVWIDALEGTETLHDKHRFQQYWETASPRSGEGPASFDVSDDTLRIREDAGRRGTRFIFSRGGRVDEEGEMKISGDLTIAAGAKAPLYFSIDNSAGTFALSLSVNGESHLEMTGRPAVPLKHAPLEAGRAYRVELLVYDGIAIAIVDGDVVAEIDYCSTHEEWKALHSGKQVAFGSEGALYTLSTLRVGRDFQYQGRSNIEDGTRGKIHIDPGHYVMMGDNVNNSHDSRMWNRITFKLKNGREIHCEGMELKDDSPTLARLAVDRKLPRNPDVWIKADEYGIEHILYNDQLDDETPRSSEPWRYVDERFLVGKALWIWWPPARAGRLIR